MVPAIINETARWLDRFTEVLDRWESILNEVQGAFVVGNYVEIINLTSQGELIHADIESCRQDRKAMLDKASSMGYHGHSLKSLSQQLDSQWPALWTHRLAALELQLNRIQQLSMALWVTAFQSKSFVSELLLILATGNSERATYAPGDSHSLEGGFLINEAA